MDKSKLTVGSREDTEREVILNKLKNLDKSKSADVSSSKGKSRDGSLSKLFNFKVKQSKVEDKKESTVPISLNMNSKSINDKESAARLELEEEDSNSIIDLNESVFNDIEKTIAEQNVRTNDLKYDSDSIQNESESEWSFSFNQDDNGSGLNIQEDSSATLFEMDISLDTEEIKISKEDIPEQGVENSYVADGFIEDELVIKAEEPVMQKESSVIQEAVPVIQEQSSVIQENSQVDTIHCEYTYQTEQQLQSEISEKLRQELYRYNQEDMSPQKTSSEEIKEDTQHMQIKDLSEYYEEELETISKAIQRYDNDQEDLKEEFPVEASMTMDQLKKNNGNRDTNPQVDKEVQSSFYKNDPYYGQLIKNTKNISIKDFIKNENHIEGAKIISGALYVNRAASQKLLADADNECLSGNYDEARRLLETVYICSLDISSVVTANNRLEKFEFENSHQGANRRIAILMKKMENIMKMMKSECY